LKQVLIIRDEFHLTLIKYKNDIQEDAYEIIDF